MSDFPKDPADHLHARMAEELRIAAVLTSASRQLSERAARVIHEARVLRGAPPGMAISLAD